MIHALAKANVNSPINTQEPTEFKPAKEPASQPVSLTRTNLVRASKVALVDIPLLV